MSQIHAAPRSDGPDAGEETVPLPPGYQALRTFPTNHGRTVQAVRTPTGELVLVKRAFTPEWAAELEEQVRHFRVVEDVTGTHGIYPDVIEHRPGLLVLRHYPHGSIDELSLTDAHPSVLALTDRSLSLHAQLSATSIDQASSPAVALQARRFLPEQASARLERLRRAMAGAPNWAAGAPSGHRFSRADLLARATAWIEDKRSLAESLP
jgi:hypothetical protein